MDFYLLWAGSHNIVSADYAENMHRSCALGGAWTLRIFVARSSFFLQRCSAASHRTTINPNLHVFQPEPLADLLQHRATLAGFKHITACNTFLSREVFVKCGISTPTTSLWFDKMITSDNMERQAIKRFSFSICILWIYLTYPWGKEPIENVCTVEANLFVQHFQVDQSDLSLLVYPGCYSSLPIGAGSNITTLWRTAVHYDVYWNS